VEKRAGADAMYPYPPQEEGTYGNLAGSVHFNRAWESIRPKLTGRTTLTRFGLRRTNFAFLRNLLTITRFAPLVNGLWGSGPIWIEVPVQHLSRQCLARFRQDLGPPQSSTVPSSVAGSKADCYCIEVFE